MTAEAGITGGALRVEFRRRLPGGASAAHPRVCGGGASKSSRSPQCHSSTRDGPGADLQGDVLSAGWLGWETMSGLPPWLRGPHVGGGGSHGPFPVPGVLTGSVFPGAVYICTEDAFPSQRLQQLIAQQQCLRADVPGEVVRKIKFSNQIFIKHAADVVSVLPGQTPVPVCPTFRYRHAT